MQFIDPPDGRPWALIGIAGTSLVLNVILGVALAVNLSGGAAAPAEEVPVASVDDPAPSVETPSEGAVAEGADEAQAVEEPVATPDLPDGVRVASATVERNLAYTFHKAVGEGSDAVSAATARLFVWDLNLRRDLQRGDKVAVAWELDARDLPVVNAARYESLKLGDTLSAYRFQATGDAFPSYWAADGTEVPHRLVDGPLRGNYEQVTSLLKDRPSHAGMDFKVDVGADVVTPRSGTVTRADWNWSNNGNCVEVRWADGTLARFLHLSETSVKAGQRLAAGARVGASGNTGRSTAPHLHYELEKAGRTLDPVDVHGTIRRTLPEGDRARFQAEVTRLEALLTATSG